MRTLINVLAAGLLALTACGDNQKAAPEDGAAPLPIDAADPPPVDAAIDGAPATVGPCLDHPSELPRPPGGELPCELLPPGFTR